tara:strand:- start:6338 stop:7774 length:1437 start_codon:yes stop_codon:yes gene_type:complete
MSKEGYIEKNKRKKILLLCDDIRVHSGIAHIGKEIVLKSAHHYNWVQMAGAVKHPDKGKTIDLSSTMEKEHGLKDASVILYPQDGYGDSRIVRDMIKKEKPDALMLITDPRYFQFVFQIESEIRKEIPIIYLNIWDDYPAPQYNEEYYESCDALYGISKQTVNINKIVLGDNVKDKVIEYLPHGINEEIFKPRAKEDKLVSEMEKNIFNDKEFDFKILFNSRNIRRKQISDTIWAFKMFLDSLPKEKADKCCLMMKTQPIDNNGTDLIAVCEYLFGDSWVNHIFFINAHLNTEQMGSLYNIADATILLTSNEGWGLALTESLLSGTPIIANVTGGMQDQMRFIDENGKWFTPSPQIPSNNTRKYETHGEWAFPVFPACRSLQGSPITPYIWDDRCKPEDATERMKELYEMSSEERESRGMKGREWALSEEAGFTSDYQGKRFIEYTDKLFNTWEPRERYEFLNSNEYKVRTLNHNLVY